MLTINQTRDDLLSKLSFPDPSIAPAQALDDCWQAMNAALQVLQTAGEVFFTRTQEVLSFTAGTGMVAMPQSVQSVIGPARWNDSVPLRALISRGELDQFDRIYFGSDTFGAAQGQPMAYFIEDVRAGNEGEIVQSNMYLAPVPDADCTVTIDVVPDAPMYSLADFTPGTALIPVAQNYTESVFLPIARMFITRSAYWSRPDIVPSLQADYDRAMVHLSAVGGFPPVTHPDPKRATDA